MITIQSAPIRNFGIRIVVLMGLTCWLMSGGVGAVCAFAQGRLITVDPAGALATEKELPGMVRFSKGKTDPMDVRSGDRLLGQGRAASQTLTRDDGLYIMVNLVVTTTRQATEEIADRAITGSGGKLPEGTLGGARFAQKSWHNRILPDTQTRSMKLVALDGNAVIVMTAMTKAEKDGNGGVTAPNLTGEDLRLFRQMIDNYMRKLDRLGYTSRTIRRPPEKPQPSANTSNQPQQH